jgi:hypothetical protein
MKDEIIEALKAEIITLTKDQTEATHKLLNSYKETTEKMSNITPVNIAFLEQAKKNKIEREKRKINIEKIDLSVDFNS